MINVKEIIKDYLRKNGYDGLCDGDECGCWLDDFWPCEGCNDPARCRPAYRHKDGFMYLVKEENKE